MPWCRPDATYINVREHNMKKETEEEDVQNYAKQQGNIKKERSSSCLFKKFYLNSLCNIAAEKNTAVVENS